MEYYSKHLGLAGFLLLFEHVILSFLAAENLYLFYFMSKPPLILQFKATKSRSEDLTLQLYDLFCNLIHCS